MNCSSLWDPQITLQTSASFARALGFPTPAPIPSWYVGMSDLEMSACNRTGIPAAGGAFPAVLASAALTGAGQQQPEASSEAAPHEHTVETGGGAGIGLWHSPMRQGWRINTGCVKYRPHVCVQYTLCTVLLCQCICNVCACLQCEHCVCTVHVCIVCTVCVSV